MQISLEKCPKISKLVNDNLYFHISHIKLTGFTLNYTSRWVQCYRKQTDKLKSWAQSGLRPVAVGFIANVQYHMIKEILHDLAS
jgi:hypothetical protein